jgi:hypothetical protein
MEPNHRSKTLGPRAAHLIAELHERQKMIFTIKDVEKTSRRSAGSGRSPPAVLREDLWSGVWQPG